MGAAERDEIRQWIPEALQSVDLALGRLKSVIDSFALEIEHMGNFPSLFLGTVTPEGALEYYDGQIRIVDAEGNVVADGLDPLRYSSYLGEASEEWSFMKFPYYKPLGYPGGVYRVGPLARLNVAKSAGTPRADRELQGLQAAQSGGPSANRFTITWRGLSKCFTPWNGLKN